MIQQAISHYRLFKKLGAGGMGEVYLAEDARLGRKVALKVLPESLSTDGEAKRRFAREARTASALNHPHIITIYDIAADDGREFIVMEYIEGETLRTLLERGTVEIKRALEVAAQVASGLAAAHAAGIVHRDIKPENLIITPSSQVKILDFGLAKLAEKQRAALAASEVTTAALAETVKNETAPGTILGTVAYMSPEQAEGRAVDQRTDIFSLGVVLYEMLAGTRPFAGKSAIDTMHAIINHEPPSVVELNPRVPVEAADILGKALAKDAAERYRHAGDFELDLRRLKRAIETNSLLSTRTQTPPKSLGRRTSKSTLAALATVSVLAIVAVAFAAWRFGRSGISVPRTASLENVKLAPLTTDPDYEGEPTFSPDGETIAYVSDRSGNLEIYLKQISGGADINLTNNPADDVQPAFSPDGKQIVFVSTRASKSDLIYRSPHMTLMGGDIWVMPALGGSPRRIVEEGNFPSWSPDGTIILYTAGQWNDYRIFSVPASGGAAREIPLKFKAVEPPPIFLLYPSYSSDGRWILFETQGEIVYVVSADGGEPQQIAEGRRPVWSTDSDAVIFSNAEPGKNLSLWRVPFSTVEGKTSGTPEPLTVGRGRDTQAAVSRNGKLIAFATQDVSFNIEWVSFDAETGRMSGTPQTLTAGDNRYYFFDVSPDGRSIVAESHRGAGYNIWRVDAGVPAVQLTSNRNFEDRFPKWSPDGSRIAFTRRGIQPRSKDSMWLMAADGANPQLMFEKTGNFRWTPDGRALVYYSDRQIYAFDLTSRSKRQITNESGAMQVFNVSYDGKWIIYQSTLQSGVPDIRAIPFEGGAARAVAATSGEDYHPFVSPSGKWLYFQPNHKNLYRVPGPAQDWRQAAPEKVTDFPESNLYIEDPQFSRDGRRLFFSRARITSDIWIMELGN